MIERVVRLTVNFSVTEAQMNDFKSIAAQMTDGTRSEPGTLGYEWFVSSDG
jgi:quinol monooxygenase YgiN